MVLRKQTKKKNCFVCRLIFCQKTGVKRGVFLYSPRLRDTLNPSLATLAALLTTSSHSQLQRSCGITDLTKTTVNHFNFSLPSIQPMGTVKPHEHSWHPHKETCLQMHHPMNGYLQTQWQEQNLKMHFYIRICYLHLRGILHHLLSYQFRCRSLKIYHPGFISSDVMN